MEVADEGGTLPGAVTYEEPAPKELYPKIQDIEDRTGDNLKVDESSSVRANSPAPPVTTGFNFWDVNSYRRTVRRIDDGAKLCDDLLKLLAERAEIEGLYAAKLQGWSKKWNDLINKGSEYGSVKNSWLNITTEADQLAEIHSELQIRLGNQVHGGVQQWKSANYHKSLLSWKETKNAEEGFSKAQKPWAKRHDEVLKCKRAYYQACKVRDQTEKLYKEASVEGSTVTDEQVKKLKEKSDKAAYDVQTTRGKYEESLRDIGNYNPKYMEDMRYVFDKCQQSEEERKNFFKTTFLNYCQQMSLEPHFNRISSIYSNLNKAFEEADVPADISWWSVNFGTEMPTRWPEFEEYTGQDEQTVTMLQQQQQQTAVTQTNNSQGAPDSPSAKKSSVCTTL
ncbi:protein kinase C and casein kinase substrate in neurons protein 1-like [Oculina patagonica]